MKVSIHQPQYLPWSPYFKKISEADIFIILDSVDFQKNGLQNRNQIKTSQGAHWLTVPVKQHLGQKICEARIQNSSNWRKKHWQTIQQNYSKAPFFSMYVEELRGIYEHDWTMLGELNVSMLDMFLRWMDIHTQLVSSSKLVATGAASDLVLNLCLEVGSTHYLSGVGGKNYIDLEAFDKAGIEVVFRDPVLPKVYPQCFPKAGFVKSLSMLDLMLNCGESWRDYFPADGFYEG